VGDFVSLRECLGEGAREMLMRLDGPMPMFATLSPQDQDDVLDGRCIYRQHEHMAILDYTRKWGVESDAIAKPSGMCPNQSSS
jgi:hypothetical protein